MEFRYRINPNPNTQQSITMTLALVIPPHHQLFDQVFLAIIPPAPATIGLPSRLHRFFKYILVDIIILDIYNNNNRCGNRSTTQQHIYI